MPTRRKLMVAVAPLALAAAITLSACTKGAVEQTQVPGGAPVDVATQTAPAEGLTVGTTEGPYYITDTAQLKDGNLNATNLPGEPIKVSGYVYSDADTATPIPGAKVEIWHTDSSGTYHPNSNGSASQYPASELALRGYVLADENGYYEFTSIYPGYYEGRTRHIHVRTSAAGFGGVTTQIIVPPKEGDRTTPADDPIAQSLPASYQVTFTDNNGVGETTFDFHLGPD